MDFHQYSKEIVKEYIASVAYVDDVIFSGVLKTDTVPVAVNFADSKDSECPGNAEKQKTVSSSFDIREQAAKVQTQEQQALPTEKKDEKRELNIDPLAFTNAFLKQGIHCTLMELSEDNNNLQAIKNTLRKSDVVILDWQMHRDLGKSAIELLTSVLKGNQNGNPELRLFIIYTDAPNYKTILSATVIPKLKENGIGDFTDEKEVSVRCGHSKIVVFRKKGNDTEKFVADASLPENIIEEFTEIVEGLVSNTALKSVALLRKNTNELLGLFNKDLDRAYLTHRALCPNPEDAESLLVHSIVDTMEAVLTYANISEACDAERIGAWIDGNDINKQTERLKFAEHDVDFVFDKDQYKKWLRDGYSKFARELEDPRFGKIDKSSIKKIEDTKLNNLVSTCFPDEDNHNKEFAILTHHKNCLKNPAYIPYMTLGVAVKDENGEYHLCIQQRCDSLRIEDDENNESGGRAFLFLPLKSEGKGSLIIFKCEDKEFEIRKICGENCHFLKTFVFPSTSNGMVKAGREENKLYFKDKDGKKYEWIFELKDAHAQKIANDFAAKLSRVGLDGSEWLRRR